MGSVTIRLRLAGFGFTAAGALLAGIGAARPWAEVAVAPAAAEAGLSTRVHGVDTIEGKVVLAAAVAMLVAVAAMRAAASPSARRALASVIVGAGLLAAGLAARDAATPRAAFAGDLDDTARRISEASGLPFDALRQQLERLTRVSRQPGVFLPIVGGALGVVGGLLGAAWAGRTQGTDAPPPDAESGAGEA